MTSIEIGTQNKLLSQDIKFGIFGTMLMIEGVIKVGKPIAPIVGSSVSRRLARQKRMKYVSDRRDRIRRGAKL